MKTPSFSLIIPLYQAEKFLPSFWAALEQQTLLPSKILWIDSSSSDQTVPLLRNLAKGSDRLRGRTQIEVIPKSEFNHSLTRHRGTQWAPAEIYVFMTQDALLASPQTFETLMACYQDPSVGCAYGRQLPHQNASILASHARAFNYPDQDQLRSFEDRKHYGAKTHFNSNSFSSYRASAYEEAGGFSLPLILGEDAYLAAKMLLNGWKIYYASQATVYHSHNYLPQEEFRRYFDIGVFHASQAELLQAFDSPNAEGRRYVRSEWLFCWRHRAFKALGLSILTLGAKWLGYQLGRRYRKIPFSLCQKFSMHKGFWDNLISH